MESKSISEIKKKVIHNRNMDILTYSCENENSIVVEGRLKDDRLVNYYVVGGEQKPPGTIHHMVIRMLVTGPTLTISDIEAEMLEIPREQCPEIACCVKKIKGINIAPGMTEKVKKLLSGVNGCAHLTHLLLTMASAAVQGYWTNRAQHPIPNPKPDDPIIQFLLDTCHVWRKDGPLVEQMKILIESTN
jgi:hypothetical protein